MKKLALIGHPVGHSKSPLIHNYWIKEHGLDASYQAIDVPESEFEQRVQALLDDGYEGFNFTTPHKIMALDFCDCVLEVAQEMKAINTLFKSEEGLCGTNTDSYGFIENLKTEAPDFDIRNNPSVVLGAGGAARGVIHGLLKEGAKEVRVLNRTRAKADALAVKDSRISVVDWERKEDALPEAGLLVNTTSLGMSGQPDLKIDLFMLPHDTVVYDIIYSPLKTKLLEVCEDRGNKIINGVGMLVHQARKSFEAWFGILPEYDDALHDLLMVELEVV